MDKIAPPTFSGTTDGGPTDEDVDGVVLRDQRHRHHDHRLYLGQWVTGSTARVMAATQGEKTVLKRLTPICIAQLNGDPRKAERSSRR